MSIAFVDLRSQYLACKNEIDEAIQRVLDHAQFVMGPEIEILENRLSEYVGVKYAITCGSGTEALLLPLLAYDLKRSDPVFTTPYTFFASAEAISLAGATPVFIDVNPETFNIDPHQLEQGIVDALNAGKSTPKGILPVDLFGLAADYDEINRIAEKYDLFVLEDAAQSFGGTYRGRKTGTLGHAAAVSFFPAKPLGCYGDGGAVFTDDEALAEKLVSIRIHGQNKDQYDNIRIGLNARMDTMQAAILLQKLEFFDVELRTRNRIAKMYTEKLNDNIAVQKIPRNCTSSWAVF